MATPRSPEKSSRRKTSPANLAEEIERIQIMLRRLDEMLSERKEEVSLKELAQAVHTAGDGGRSIAQLRKFARELEKNVLDEDTQRLQSSLRTLLERLGERRKSAPAGPPDGSA